MIDINIQLFGGRGAPSGTGKSNDGSGRAIPLWDKTDEYKDYSLHEYEEAIRNREHEWIGLFDKDGKLLFAGTSYKTNRVAIPGPAVTNEAVTLTHNHPTSATRLLGATFSIADVKNTIALDLTTRAVASGKGEFVYQIKKGKNHAGKTSDEKMLKYINNTNNTYETKYDKLRNKIVDKARTEGKKITSTQSSAIYLGLLKKRWKSSKVEKYGYEYTEVKKKRW